MSRYKSSFSMRKWVFEIYINGFVKYLFFGQPTLKYHVNCPRVYSILYQDYFWDWILKAISLIFKLF